jgi:N-acetylglucosamine kinase-like BadF-type ATPase
VIALIADGGGTKTRAWLVDLPNKRILQTIEAGPSNFGKVRAEGLRAVLRDIRHAIQAEQAWDCAVLGLAGVGREPERIAALAAAEAEWPNCKIRVAPDAELAYRGAFAGGRQGVLLICGTGTIAYGQTPASREFQRVGGWGPLLGDEGGGAWLGREAIRLCLFEYERDELSAFHSAVLDELHLEFTPQLITKVYSGNYGPGEWAQLAPLVFDYAHEDPSAMRILTQMAIELVDLVERIAEQLLPEAPSIPLVVTGGLWARRDLLQPLIEREIGIRNLPIVISEPAGGPMEGGMLLLER